jgi:hypothetical protein
MERGVGAFMFQYRQAILIETKATLSRIYAGQQLA